MELIFEGILNLGIIVMEIFNVSNLMSDPKLNKKSMKKLRSIQICRNVLMIILIIALACTIPALVTISIWFIAPVVASVITVIALMVNMNIKYFKQKNSKI